MTNERDEMLGEIAGTGGSTDLIINYVELLPQGRQAQHGFHEIACLAAAACEPIEPAGAHDHVARAVLLHRALTGQPRFSVHRKWAGFVLLNVRRTLGAIKNVVGAELNQAGACRLRRLGNMCDSAFVYRERQLLLLFAVIYAVKSSSVDDDFRSSLGNHFANALCIANVELLVGHWNHGVAAALKLLAQILCQLATCADEQHFHAPQDSTAFCCDLTPCPRLSRLA